MVELYLGQGRKLLKECGDNFDNLVLKLEFKYNKLTVQDMNKILYQDYSSFAASPQSLKKVSPKKRIASQEMRQSNAKSLNPYFRNRPKTKMVGKSVRVIHFIYIELLKK